MPWAAWRTASRTCHGQHGEFVKEHPDLVDPRLRTPRKKWSPQSPRAPWAHVPGGQGPSGRASDPSPSLWADPVTLQSSREMHQSCFRDVLWVGGHRLNLRGPKPRSGKECASERPCKESLESSNVPQERFERYTNRCPSLAESLQESLPESLPEELERTSETKWEMQQSQIISPTNLISEAKRIHLECNLGKAK
jgi:hypothetical protein